MIKNTFVVSLLLAGMCTHCLAGGDPKGEANHAARQQLPQGKGLATAYPADAGIAQHADVIFADDFERERDVKGAWDEARNAEIQSLIPSGDPARLGQRSLRVTSTLGKNTGGGLTRWFKPTESVFIRFYVRFDENCDYVHHFATLRANKSLQGSDRWSGFGKAGLLPKGNERFSTALEPWGDWGRLKPPGRWNFYSYWHEMTAAPDKKYWGNAFRPAEQANIKKDTWICAEFMLKENTPGKPDGEQAFWIDGKLRGHWKGINWRTSPTLHANALTLEAYITDRWTKNPINIVDFDNLVIAKRYIGPTGTK
jgi:hypothetical protein